ncbi:hypothetical protein V8G54_014709 [Vigna mungo]|uniref:Uncharacterized protein n=1 Tax=Vigna mungo TaxID=3915 RepID=A0AAQ3RW78_VIGMU
MIPPFPFPFPDPLLILFSFPLFLFLPYSVCPLPVIPIPVPFPFLLSTSFPIHILIFIFSFLPVSIMLVFRISTPLSFMSSGLTIPLLPIPVPPIVFILTPFSSSITVTVAVTPLRISILHLVNFFPRFMLSLVHCFRL